MPIKLSGFLFAFTLVAMMMPAAWSQGNPSTPQGEVQGSQNPPSTEVHQGLGRGAYWWSDMDVTGIAGLVESGVDTVAFRLGKLRNKPGQNNGQGVAGSTVAFETDVDFTKFANLPLSISYRPVIETDSAFWRDVNLSDLRSFLRQNVMPALLSAGITPAAIEIKLPRKTSPDFAKLAIFLNGEAQDNVPITLGVDPDIVVSFEVREIRYKSARPSRIGGLSA